MPILMALKRILNQRRLYKNPQVLEYVLYKAINLDFETFDIPDASEKCLKYLKKITIQFMGLK